MIKVALVDDQQLIINGLKMMVDLQPDMTVIWTANNGHEALLKIASDVPDVMLLDIRMPEMNGVDTTKAVKGMHPEVKILILTTFNEDQYIFESLKHGANGYLLKDVPPEELMSAIRKIHLGGTIIEPGIATKVIQNIKLADEGQKQRIIELLTSRELDISRLIAQGFSNKETAEALFISEGTVKNHLTSILEKLELRDRTQLAILILKNDI